MALRLVTTSFLMTFSSFSEVDEDEFVMAEAWEVMEEAVATMAAILDVTLDEEEYSLTLTDRLSSLPLSSLSLLLSL